MFKSTRRLITGVDENQQSKLLTHENIKPIVPYDIFPSFQLQNLFYTEDHPQSLTTRHLEQAYNIALPEGAVRFLKMRMPTKLEMIADLKKAGKPIPQDWTRYNLHSTDSVDYCYVLSGKITCIVGEHHINLSEGDFLVQIGPEHTWINDHDEPCYMFCIMIGIKPSGQRKKMDVEYKAEV